MTGKTNNVNGKTHLVYGCSGMVWFGLVCIQHTYVRLMKIRQQQNVKIPIGKQVVVEMSN